MTRTISFQVIIYYGGTPHDVIPCSNYSQINRINELLNIIMNSWTKMFSPVPVASFFELSTVKLNSPDQNICQIIFAVVEQPHELVPCTTTRH